MQFSNTTSVSISLSGGESWGYGNTLTSAELKNIIVIPRDENIVATSAYTGTVANAELYKGIIILCNSYSF